MQIKKKNIAVLIALSLSALAVCAGSHAQQRILEKETKPDCNTIDIDSPPNLCSPQLIWRNHKYDGKPIWRGDTSEQALEAFDTGILPHAIKNSLPETERSYDWDLHRFMSNRSVLSSTTADLATSLRFIPDAGGWIYEIYAPGGIDQEASIGMKPQSERTPIKPLPVPERELSFPGGIKGRFIKSACYYKNKIKQRCVDNPNFVTPDYQETPEQVAAAIVDFKKITPKARCEDQVVAAATPGSLCFQPNMASAERYVDDLMKIKTVGLRVKYDVSDRGDNKNTRWILLTGDVDVSSIPSTEEPLPPSKILAQIPISADAKNTGEIIIPASLFKDVELNHALTYGDIWSVGISHQHISADSVTSDAFSGAISYIRVFDEEKTYPQITTDTDEIVLLQGEPITEKELLNRLNAKASDGSYITTDLTDALFEIPGKKFVSLFSNGTIKDVNIEIKSSQDNNDQAFINGLTMSMQSTNTGDSITFSGSVTSSSAATSSPVYQWMLPAGAEGGSNGQAQQRFTVNKTSQPQNLKVKIKIIAGKEMRELEQGITVPALTETGQYQLYKPGTGYTAGQVVKNKNGDLFECKPWPFTAWCGNLSAQHYEPGIGSNWSEAWNRYSK